MVVWRGSGIGLWVAVVLGALLVGGLLYLAIVGSFGRATKGHSSSARREVRAVVGAVAVLGVALAMYFVFISGGASIIRSVPMFPSLAAFPDRSLHGTVAYNALAITTPKGKQGCVYVVTVSGGIPRLLFCADQPRAMGAELKWLADGRLVATDQYAARWRKFIDVKTGFITTRPGVKVAIPLALDNYTVKGPKGMSVTTTVGSGLWTMTLTSGTVTRTLLKVGVPPNYSVNRPEWSASGTWLVVEDSAARLLVITTDVKSTTRVLIDGGWGPAVTDQVFADLAK